MKDDLHETGQLLDPQGLIVLTDRPWKRRAAGPHRKLLDTVEPETDGQRNRKHHEQQQGAEEDRYGTHTYTPGLRFNRAPSKSLASHQFVPLAFLKNAFNSSVVTRSHGYLRILRIIVSELL